MVTEPRAIIKEILAYIGDRGVIAGGAVRDIVLKRIPKDYDVFVFGKEDFDEITSQKGIFDKKPLENKAPFEVIEGYARFTVWNTSLHGEPVQLIWSRDFEKGSLGQNRELGINTSITPLQLVEGFPFTINMMWVDRRHKIQITKAAEEAIRDKCMIYNRDHRRPGSDHNRVVAYTIRRGVHLANKLGFRLGLPMVKKIFAEHYGTWRVDELDNRKWTKSGEGVVNASFSSF